MKVKITFKLEESNFLRQIIKDLEGEKTAYIS